MNNQEPSIPGKGLAGTKKLLSILPRLGFIYHNEVKWIIYFRVSNQNVAFSLCYVQIRGY